MPSSRAGRARKPFVSWALMTMLVACGEDTAAPTQVDPAGVWRYGIVVTEATGVCAGEVGESSAHEITITKTGTAPPFTVTARGFLGVAANQLTGTFDAANKLVISGSYAEGTGTTATTHTLTATSDNQMVGTEAWSWVGPGGSCPDGVADVTANRIN